jgi:hypothetical protein
LSGFLLKAQDSITTVLSKRVPTRYVILYAEPIAMLDWNNGASYRFGMEYTFASKWAVYGTAGGYLEQGYILRAGIKRFFKQEGNARHSLGLEYINTWHINTVHDDYLKQDSGAAPVADESRPVSYTTEKYINSISVMFSREAFWRHHWVFEVYAGAGVKFKRTLTSIPQSELNLLYNYQESDISNFSSTPGTFTTLDLRLGIKIGRVL